MAAFDEEWWNARCLRFGKVDTRDQVGPPSTSPVAWTRWRLVDELLRRYYVDLGLEPGFALMGTEAYQIALASPTCNRAPRYFGRLCGADVHPVAREPNNEPLDLLPPPWYENSTNDILSGAAWATWSDYLHAAISTLSLGTAGVVGHEGCFHRRGKALTPLMYRVALLIRTDRGGDPTDVDPESMVTVLGPDHRQSGIDEVEAVIVRARADVPAGPPRFMGVRHDQIGWVALRTDGWVATYQGTLDAANLWRAGANEEEIARAVVEISSK